MKKMILLSLLALMVVCTIKAEKWLDITEENIVNPSFSGNDITTGWQGTPFGAAEPMENAEHFNKVYDTYQTITGLKPGKYRVSAKAFYRMGTAYNDYNCFSKDSSYYQQYQYAQLYATSSKGDYFSRIVPASSGAQSQSLGGRANNVGGKYIPDNMLAAYYWFTNGLYENSVECEVGDDGVLRLGIRKDTTIGNDWTCVDDFRLEYWGEEVKVQSISFAEKEVVLYPTQQITLTPIILPEDATNKKVTWKSLNVTIGVVDDMGNVTARKPGQLLIRVTAQDGSNVSRDITINIKEAQVATANNTIINEVMAANVDVYRDPSTNFGSWVELYNPTEDYVSLGGLYVTDDATNMKKHRLAENYGILGPHDFAILHFDHYEVYSKNAIKQIDDKLDCDGGTIYLTDGQNVITSFTYPAAISRASYARTVDGGDTWSFTSNPTPGRSNQQGGGFASMRLPAPQVDANGGLFSGSQSLNVSVPVGATLRYTTDGTTPTMENGSTSVDGAFTVTETTCFRFRLFMDGYLPSPIVTRTYLKNNNNEPFPIIALTADKKEIMDGEYAIFGEGQYGRPGRGQNRNYNANMEWDRPVNFEYITKNNEYVISQECDYSACGGWSRAWTPHSFKLKAGKAYEGLNSFDYQFFGEKPYLKHKTLQMRNGGNDSGARIKDACITQIAGRSGLYLEYQAWQPVHVYLNGEDYGVLNMREPNNKHYGQTNYGIDTDMMDQFELSPDSGYVQMEGTKTAYLRWLTLSNRIAVGDNYQKIMELVDIDEYVNYMAVGLYIGGTDWPQNNIKGFRSTEDGKFRFVLFDTDHALGTNSPINEFFSKQNRSGDRLYGYDYSQNKNLDGVSLTLNNQFVQIFKNMLNNADFRKKFIDAYCLVGGSVYTPSRVNKIVDEIAATMKQGSYINGYTIDNTANSIKNGFAQRLDNVLNDLQSNSSMRLTGVTPQSVTLKSNITGADILVNGMMVPTGEFDGKLFAPVTLTAKAPAGYRFAGWKKESSLKKVTKSIFGQNTGIWKYYQTSLDGTDWKSDTYNDDSWASGTAPLGYASAGSAMYNTLNTKTLTKNKTCYYFRKSFNISDLKADDIFTLEYTLDDGCIVYVNGKEVARDNMPSGNVTYNSVATSYAVNNPNTGKMTIPASYIKNGTNVIAVEVHNNQASSSDIMWAAGLQRETTTGEESSIVSTDVEYKMPATGSHDLIAMWERVDEAEMINRCAAPVKINELSAGNDSKVNDYFKKDDWVELYNTTDYPIDCEGLYLSDNAQKPTKYVIRGGENANTVIPAHGHLVVWCSKRNTNKQLHANFKLANDDGSLLMLSSSEEFVNNNKAYFDAHPLQKDFVDVMHYNAHAADQTVGRFPDGGNHYFKMNGMTIGRANSLQTSDTFMAADAQKGAMLLGDANGDGKVDDADYKITMQYYMGVPAASGIVVEAADVNADGRVSMSDANAIVNILTKEKE